jgi:formylglycine-generating enzyme required for sulfatase activity
LVGPSGSGKSSVVRAGLVPKLRKETQEPWEIITMVPGGRPFRHLASALLPLLETDLREVDRLDEIGKLAHKLPEGTIELCDVITRILAKQLGTRRLLLFVDQWEELYTHGRKDGKIAQDSIAFIDQLLHASTASPLNVVLTLRADFMGDALGYRPLADRLQGGQVNLGPMNAEELQQAVTQPAALLHTSFESGLAERIIKAVDNQPGHLPLVEFVLQRLWEAKPGGMLRHQDYEAMGDLEGAIAYTADKVYQNLPAAEQPHVEKIFLQLVQVSETAPPTRRRALWSEWDEASKQIVRRLADARLLVTTENTVEVAHEALIHHWQTLQEWLDNHKEFLLWRKRLQEAMEAWDKAKHDGAALLSGARLKEAERWKKRRVDYLTKPENEYIQLGVRRRYIAQSLVSGLAVLLILIAGFIQWADQERISKRAGIYILLAKAGIYTLQPEMVAIPGGSFLMGSPDSDTEAGKDEKPQHRVTVQPFLVGKYEVTFDEYDVFSHLIENDGGCTDKHEIKVNVGDEGWGRGQQPVVNVSWEDAVCYAQWLSNKTGKDYSLPSEAEWEYAARAGTTTTYWWGDDIGNNRANCDGCSSQWSGKLTAPVGSFPANGFKLHDTIGNVWEWVADCYHDSYKSAPNDGTVWHWQSGYCEWRVVRGGAWYYYTVSARRRPLLLPSRLPWRRRRFPFGVCRPHPETLNTVTLISVLLLLRFTGFCSCFS